MTDILKTATYLAIMSAVLMAIAAWFSLNLLNTLSKSARRFHDWLQLRLWARQAGLIAYRQAVSNILKAEAQR